MAKRPASRATGRAEAGRKRVAPATSAATKKTTSPKSAARDKASTSAANRRPPATSSATKKTTSPTSAARDKASTGASRIPRASGAAATPTAAASGGDPDQVRGRVAGYTVGRKGLIVQLDCSAIYRIAFSVGPDEPHFRSAVSMAMIALNNRVNPATTGSGKIDQQYLSVWLEKGTKGQQVRPASVVAMSFNTDHDPFDIDGFVYTPDI